MIVGREGEREEGGYKREEWEDRGVRGRREGEREEGG